MMKLTVLAVVLSWCSISVSASPLAEQSAASVVEADNVQAGGVESRRSTSNAKADVASDLDCSKLSTGASDGGADVAKAVLCAARTLLD